MKIAILYNSNYRGNPKDFFLLRHWNVHNVDVEVITPPSFQQGLCKKILVAIIQVLSFITSAKKYDVVLSIGFINGIIFSITNLFLGFRRPLHIIFEPMVTRFVNKNFIFYILFQLVLPILRFSVDCIICTSSYDYYFWRNELGFGERVFLVRWGLKNDIHISLSKDEDKYIFSAGRTARDYPTLILAAKEINTEFILIVGIDTITKKTGLENIEIPKNVRVLIEVPYSQYLEYLAKSRIVVVTLQDVLTTVGISVILEAMIMGKPVIATKIPATIDYIEDHVTGLLVRPKDPQDLKEKILFLLDNPKLIRKFGFNARLKANKNHTNYAMSTNIGKIIEKFILLKETSSRC